MKGEDVMATSTSTGTTHGDLVVGIQHGINEETSEFNEFSKYSLFLGGTNSKHDVLAHYTPLTTGYARVFMVRKPFFLTKTMPNKMNKFKHILEYAFTAVSGLSDIQLDTRQIAGSYGGKSIEVPVMVNDSTNSVSITVFEFSGSPVRELLTSWINGITDLNSNLTHYNGYAKIPGVNDGSDTIDVNQANETAEFVYVVTDRTGMNVEYACLLTNCFPKNINTDVFNFQSQSHDTVETTIEFACNRYESMLAKTLIQKNMILTNSLNFHSGYKISDATPYTGSTNGTDNGGFKSKYVDINTGLLKDAQNLSAATKSEMIKPQTNWK